MKTKYEPAEGAELFGDNCSRLLNKHLDDYLAKHAGDGADSPGRRSSRSRRAQGDFGHLKKVRENGLRK